MANECSSEIKEHKIQFGEYLKRSFNFENYPLSRVILTMSCDDSDEIPKIADAGRIVDEGSESYQLMHNGIKVLEDGYCASWMTDLIYGLKGHHEPQEERVFYEVLKHMPQKATMIELGSYWGYYSLWFAHQIPDVKNYLIEPDPQRLEIGRRNFALNGKNGCFFRGYVAIKNNDDADFNGADCVLIDDFLEKNGIEHVNILHSDIQGAEYEMLHSSINAITNRKVDYFFISTHSEEIHEACIDFLELHDYHIIAEHSPAESYSVDGLVVARQKDLPGPDVVKISKRPHVK